MDLLDILLDNYTDFVKFERLAVEIMTLEGFGTITPIGGVDDQGVDAEVTKYFEDETQRIVFQFTIQENTASKISSTINKLNENGIEFQQLIVVTKNEINNIQKHKTDARVKRGVWLEIFDRATFIKHLGTSKSLVSRYFPDAKTQLQSGLFDEKSIFSSSSDEALQVSLLKCSLLFTFNKSAEGKRKRLFDHTVLSIIVNEQGQINKSFLLNEFKKHFGKDVEIGELDASLSRLKKEGYVELSKDRIMATTSTSERIGSSVARINSATKALIDDVVTKVKEQSPTRIDSRTENIISNNIKNTLNAFFQLYGVEYSETVTQASGHKIQENVDLIAIAKKGLNYPLADNLVYAIGDTLKKPTSEQSETLSNWAKSFIGAQIMGFDFKLSSFQATRLNQKTFILDTDVLLYCIVGDCSISSIYMRTIRELVILGCKIIIPREVIYETIKHAEFANRSYHYFKASVDSVDPAILESKVGNIYVKGYFSAIAAGRIHTSETSFQNYIENFWDKGHPYAFMQDILMSLFGEKVKILDTANIGNQSVASNEIESLTTLIYEETIGTVKGGYRTEEENREIAETDARLFLTAYHQHKPSDKVDEILAGSYYLVTSSTRAPRCAAKMGLYANVVAKPSAMINLLEKIGRFTPSAQEIVNLFDNPYLMDAVNNSWDDIKVLVEAGVSLKNKNIVRLKWDLDEEIKAFISGKSSSESQQSGEKETDDYLGFLRRIKNKGYELVPELEALETLVTKLQTEAESTKASQIKLRDELEKFGKRKQHYLERMTKGKSKA